MKKRRRTMMSSMDKSATLANNFRKRWTMDVRYAKGKTGKAEINVNMYKKNAGLNPAFL